MTNQVYIIKRPLRERKRNGQRQYRLALRWQDPDTGKWCCESVGSADRTQAEALQKVKWSQINGLTPRPEPAAIRGPAKAPPTWQECRDALERAMTADNLRASYIASSREAFDVLRRMFPETASPAELTADMANDYKRRRAEAGISPWSIRSDLNTLKAVFGKWLGRECGLLSVNPFATVRAPKCDDPDIRIVSAAESKQLLDWIAERWNNWRLPCVYLEIAALLGWRATEIASIREEDILADGFVRVAAETSKTRRHKFGWLPVELHAELKACVAGGFAFGRFSDELRRLLMLWKRQPNHAARVMDFAPKRLVGWLQHELQRFNAERQAAENEAASGQGRKSETFAGFTLHDFRRTAITGLQMAGVTEKETSVMVGATPEVIRKHYAKLDQQAIARRSVQRRLGIPAEQDAPVFARLLRAGVNPSLDHQEKMTQAVTA